MNVNDLTNEAVSRWVKVIGMDETGKIHGKNPWNHWELQRTVKDLNESRKLDPSGLTTFMLLRGVAEAYLKAVTFDAHSPWMSSHRGRGISLDIGITHCKQALHARRKKLGLPRLDYEKKNT